MKLLPRLYYEKETGNFLCLTNQQSYVKEIPTKVQDVEIYESLKGLNKNRIAYIQLGFNYDPYTNEFMTGHCVGVNLDGELPEPIFEYTEEEQEQLQELKTREQLTKDIEVLSHTNLQLLNQVSLLTKDKENNDITLLGLMTEVAKLKELQEITNDLNNEDTIDNKEGENLV